MKLISEPTLLLDKKIARNNIKKMAEKAIQQDITLKPHVKTHQSLTIGNWLRDFGIKKITVSSVKMAQYFARDGWDDITIAFPYNKLKAKQVNELAQKINLSLLISDPNIISLLNGSVNEEVGLYIEIDTGAKRTGFSPDSVKQIDMVMERINEMPLFHVKGFYSHPGHSYRCRTPAQIQNIHRSVLDVMQQLKDRYKSTNPTISTCIGDTPCCSVANNFEGIDEISPGNFVFYDLMQQQIGSCAVDDIGVALACPVVATYAQRKELIIHGGVIHLSKEALTIDGKSYYGKIVSLNNNLSWNKVEAHCYIKSISQEHGIVKCSDSFFSKISIGDILGILPVHSCLTADTMKGYTTTKTNIKIDHLQAFNEM